MSPALILGHEMAHATGGPESGSLAKIKVPGYDNLEEHRVISGPETDAARTLGEGVRTDHDSGVFVPVKSPTDR